MPLGLKWTECMHPVSISQLIEQRSKCSSGIIIIISTIITIIIIRNSAPTIL